MRIINGDEFNKLRGNVLFTEYRPRVGDGCLKIAIQLDGSPGFTYIPLTGSEPHYSESDEKREMFYEEGAEIRASFSTTYSDTFSPNKLYIVYDQFEIDELIDTLKNIRTY